MKLTLNDRSGEVSLVRADYHVPAERPHRTEHVQHALRHDEEYLEEQDGRDVPPGLHVGYRALGAPVHQQDEDQDDETEEGEHACHVGPHVVAALLALPRGPVVLAVDDREEDQPGRGFRLA